jgi:hypothetical protein
MLQAVEARLRMKSPVAVHIDPQDPELEINLCVRLYFEHHLPLYHDTRLLLHGVPANPPSVAYELVSPNTLRGEIPVETIRWPTSYRGLGVARRVSAALQFKKEPHLVLDHGVHDFRYQWYFYRRGLGHPPDA